MIQEMKIFDALKPTPNENIIKYKIPTVYYSGPFLRFFNCIAMTLFDGCLEHRIKLQKKKRQTVSELSVLIIFKQAVRNICKEFEFVQII